MYWPSARSSIIATLRSRPLRCTYDSTSLKGWQLSILPTTTWVLVGQGDQRVRSVATGFVERDGNVTRLAALKSLPAAPSLRFDDLDFVVSPEVKVAWRPWWPWVPWCTSRWFQRFQAPQDGFAVCQGRRFAVSKGVCRMINTSPGTKQSAALSSLSLLRKFMCCQCC